MGIPNDSQLQMIWRWSKLYLKPKIFWNNSWYISGTPCIWNFWSLSSLILKSRFDSFLANFQKIQKLKNNLLYSCPFYESYTSMSHTVWFKHYELYNIDFWVFSISAISRLIELCSIIWILITDLFKINGNKSLFCWWNVR